MTDVKDEIKSVDEDNSKTKRASQGGCDCGDCDCENTACSSGSSKTNDVRSVKKA